MIPSLEGTRDLPTTSIFLTEFRNHTQRNSPLALVISTMISIIVIITIIIIIIIITLLLVLLLL